MRSINEVLKIPRNTFREHIADALREQVLDGTLAPGSALVEARLAAQFGVSRGPLREAIRQLTEEGLLVTKAYTGTHVLEISAVAARELFALRTTLEIFAFEECWSKRSQAFHRELVARHERLSGAIRACDDRLAMSAELALHSLAYEASGNTLLLSVWRGMSGRLQMYWAAHHLAHGRRAARLEAHDRYVMLAGGDDLAALVAEIKAHMRQGESRTQDFLKHAAVRRDASRPVASPPPPSSSRRHVA